MDKTYNLFQRRKLQENKVIKLSHRKTSPLTSGIYIILSYQPPAPKTPSTYHLITKTLSNFSQPFNQQTFIMDTLPAILYLAPGQILHFPQPTI